MEETDYRNQRKNIIFYTIKNLSKSFFVVAADFTVCRDYLFIFLQPINKCMFFISASDNFRISWHIYVFETIAIDAAMRKTYREQIVFKYLLTRKILQL